MMLSTIFTKYQLLDLYPQLAEVNEENGKMLIDEIEGYYEDETFPDAQNTRTKGSFTPDVTKDYDYGEGSEKYQLIESFSKTKALL